MEGLRFGAPQAQTGRVMGMRNPQGPPIDPPGSLMYIYVALACLLVLARSPAILVTAFSSRSRRLVRLARTKSETAPSTLPLKALAVRKTSYGPFTSPTPSMFRFHSPLLSLSHTKQVKQRLSRLSTLSSTYSYTNHRFSLKVMFCVPCVFSVPSLVAFLLTLSPILSI